MKTAHEHVTGPDARSHQPPHTPPLPPPSLTSPASTVAASSASTALPREADGLRRGGGTRRAAARLAGKGESACAAKVVAALARVGALSVLSQRELSEVTQAIRRQNLSLMEEARALMATLHALRKAIQEEQARLHGLSARLLSSRSDNVMSSVEQDS